MQEAEGRGHIIHIPFTPPSKSIPQQIPSPFSPSQLHPSITRIFRSLLPFPTRFTMPTNTAAWLTGAKVSPLQVKSAPYTTPRENEIVIKNGAVAINPIDWMLQDQGTSIMFTWLKYPFVLGTDVAGEVVEIGSRVTRFNIGDRVVGHAVGKDQKRNRSAECAFQTYTVLLAHMASP